MVNLRSLFAAALFLASFQGLAVAADPPGFPARSGAIDTPSVPAIPASPGTLGGRLNHPDTQPI